MPDNLGVPVTKPVNRVIAYGTSPFNPLHILDVAHWFDPTSIPLVGGNVQKFSAVRDMGTAGYLSQPSGAAQASVVPNGNNGSAVFRGIGTAAIRQDSNGFVNALLANKPYYIVVAAKVNTVPSGVHYEFVSAGLTNLSSHQFVFCSNNSGGSLTVQYFDGAQRTAVAAAGPGTIPLGVWSLLEVEYDVSNYLFYINGKLVDTVAKLGDAVYASDIHMGGGSATQALLDGDMGDVVLCKNRLGLSDRSDLRAWLAKKWNIQGVRLL